MLRTAAAEIILRHFFKKKKKKISGPETVTGVTKGAPETNAVLFWVSSKTGRTPPSHQEYWNFWGKFLISAPKLLDCFGTPPPPLMEENQHKAAFFQRCSLRCQINILICLFSSFAYIFLNKGFNVNFNIF